MDSDQIAKVLSNKARVKEIVADLTLKARQAEDEDEASFIISEIAQLVRAYRIRYGIGLPANPAVQAQELDPNFRIRPHSQYLADSISNAVRDVEQGINRQLVISLPPRAGKSLLTSYYTPLWILRRHPDWKHMLVSYDGGLTANWARDMRTLIESNPGLGISLNQEKRSLFQWETREKGGIYATSTRGSLTGRGARVIIMDDPIRDFVEAHSATMRNNLWNWWLSVPLTRLEPPYLLIVVATRWHEDDIIGRILSTDYEGNPGDWENIKIPAIADEENDLLGRELGEPLLSPMFEENPESAVQRWDSVRGNVGSYTWAGMYQQRPAPQKGAIFDSGWWRFWTRDPEKVTDDGLVVLLNPGEETGAGWLDSWDMAFKGGDDGSKRGGGWVVGQRWMKKGANRFLILQQRGHWSFTQTLAKLQEWAQKNDPALSPYGHLVHETLIEDKANGTALIDVMRDHVAGIKPIKVTLGKEARARIVTPEIESGNVYLPHPSDPGNEWVNELLSELRNFPHDAADDQVDALTQALTYMRSSGLGGVTVPGSSNNRLPGTPGWSRPRNIARTALEAQRSIRRGY